MSKNNIVIITTRWMSPIVNDEGLAFPIHCAEDSRFTSIALSNAKELAEYIHGHEPDRYWGQGPDYDNYFSLEESAEGANYKVFIVPCLASCSDPEAWIRALVNQFSQPNDTVRMMVHASSDLKLSGPQVFASYAGITDRDLKIRAFNHSAGDVASRVLLRDTYKEGVTASAVFTYLSCLCESIGSFKKKFKQAWEGYQDGDVEIDSLCEAYHELLSAVKLDIRAFSLMPEDEFKMRAEGIDDNPKNIIYINQIVDKF